MSYVVNGLLNGQQIAFEDSEVEKGRTYKYRSPDYVTSGKHYNFGKVEFDESLSYFEWQLLLTKSQFEEHLKFSPIHREWNQIPVGETNFFFSNFDSQLKTVEELFNKNVVLYFPPNRFEEPAWLNINNLNAKAEFTERLNLQRHSNRKIITTSPLKLNKNWVLDILFDRNVLELKSEMKAVAVDGFTVLRDTLIYSGESHQLYEVILSLLQLIIRKDGDLRFGIESRRDRKVALILNDKPYVPNIFQMSTGETALLNLFLSILRDFDLTQQVFSTFNDVKGVVVVDEIDLHLHSVHQRTILPELIKAFPKIQFIITTHSPLFVLGLEHSLGQDGFSLIQMPQGLPISAEQFSEFEPAYLAFRASKKFENEITTAISSSQKPVLFVEGDYDIRYLNKAASLLDKTNIIEKIEIKEAGGEKNLSKIWNNFEPSLLAKITQQKVLLLYDCDVNCTEGNKGTNIYRKVIPTNVINPISKGIENLFSRETFEKVLQNNPKCLDRELEHEKWTRGERQVIPEILNINKDEKGNVCNWLCTNGNATDFQGFNKVFEIIEEFLT